MPNKIKNWNTRELRQFDFDKYGMSISPYYTGEDLLGFKPASQHFKRHIRGLNR